MKRQTTYIRLSEITVGCKTAFCICAAVITLAAVFSLTGCVKDELYNTPHPDKGALVITADWSGRSADAEQPERYIIKVDGQPYEVSELFVTPAASAGRSRATFSPVLPALFTPGIHSLVVYNEPKGFTIDGNTATVGTLEDGTLNPLPGYLFSATEEPDIAADDTLRITVPMRQRIRRLSLQLELTAEDAQRIAATEATLTGIASAFDFSAGAIASTEGKTIAPAFAVQTPPTGGQPLLTATMRLLGTVPAEQQILTLHITLKNGDIYSVAKDLTEPLKNFSTGSSMEPLELDALLELPTEIGVTTEITPWNPGNGENGETGSAE